MPFVGHGLLLAATAATLFGLVAYGRAARQGRLELARQGRVALGLATLLVTAASLILLVALIQTDFRFAYVVRHTNRDLPLLYRVAAFWAGQEGSLLLWLWILLVEGFLALGWRRGSQGPEAADRLEAPAGALLLGIALFFELLVVTVSSPFGAVATPPADGRGLNPLLQNPGMLIHPVTLYLGYVGFTVPFALAFGALILGDGSDAWIERSRRWSLAAWLFLTLGIVYGMQWAYVELGWGGFWAWDPVENASLIPWLTATAYLHGARVWQQRGCFKVGTVGLLAATFLLTIFGTYLTRSGVVSSVHAFAPSTLGSLFLGFLILLTVGTVAILIWRRDLLQDEVGVDNPISREGSFLLAMLLLAAAALVVFLGTLSPILSGWLLGTRIQLDAAFYNRVVPPIGLLIVAVMGLAPLLPWGRATRRTWRRLVWPLGLAGAVTLGLAAAGIHHGLALAAALACFFALAVTLPELLKGFRGHARGLGGRLKGALRAARRNPSRVGGYLVHIGVAVMVVGMVGATVFETSADVVLQPGQMTELAGHRLHYAGLRQRMDSPSQVTIHAELILLGDGRPLGRLRPEKVFYTYARPTTEPAILGGPRGDLYVILNGWEEGGRQASFTLVWHPLISWMWWGAYIMAAGGLIAFGPTPQARSRGAARSTPPALPAGEGTGA
ncbi:MAG: cytochrome c-type biogenesis CcmF C-terminal domain-containing protein [Limnochorda sp.]|uniref:heme lyase CcmF/NrfE family subunit n=1 Tax=Limnochorda sp. TaxID=1940279 RepID=UPI001D80F23A|nr:cytochrome C biogenesis protein [Bacillota bacterium]MBO2518664.1 cytochrome C biogenesis protein [Bacillota bacterium]